jgi:hypothetical protein
MPSSRMTLQQFQRFWTRVEAFKVQVWRMGVEWE